MSQIILRGQRAEAEACRTPTKPHQETTLAAPALACSDSSRESLLTTYHPQQKARLAGRLRAYGLESRQRSHQNQATDSYARRAQKGSAELVVRVRARVAHRSPVMLSARVAVVRMTGV